jgi:osmoprotectant transport system permease protein
MVARDVSGCEALRVASTVVTLPAGGNCLVDNAWVCGRYLTTRSGDILAALGQHVILTVLSVAIGFAIALPLSLVVRRWRRSEPGVLAGTSFLYTIPSLALFALLVPFTGLTAATVVIGLVLFTLVILVRNIVAGLDSVPGDVRDAATGMGYGPLRTLLRVELPIALPAVIAGLRVATVSTVALVTVGAIIGEGGLGNLIYDAIGSNFKAEVATDSVLCVLLAVVADLLLLGVQRVLTPWRSAPRTRGLRSRRGSEARRDDREASA